MSQQSLQLFANAVGAERPLRLTVSGPDAAQTRMYQVDQPFLILGNAPESNVRLSGDQVAYRHLYLQVLRGGVVATDLFRIGRPAMEGPNTEDWLCDEGSITVGAYRVKLADDGWLDYDPAVPSPFEFKPSMHSDFYGTLPTVRLVLQNRALEGMSWPINRAMSLVGRDPRCRITCKSEHISKVHCCLLLLPSGLWAVDLLGRNGIAINGQKVSCGHLGDGSELTVGPYRMQARYEQASAEARAPVDRQRDKEVEPVRADLPTPEFMTRTHEVFQAEADGHTLIVTPQAHARDFRYQTIQLEGNRITHLLKTRGFDRLVVDLAKLKMVDSIILSSVAQFCRAARVKAALCNATQPVYEALCDTQMQTIWPHYASREDAVLAVNLTEVNGPTEGG